MEIAIIICKTILCVSFMPLLLKYLEFTKERYKDDPRDETIGAGVLLLSFIYMVFVVVLFIN